MPVRSAITVGIFLVVLGVLPGCQRNASAIHEMTAVLDIAHEGSICADPEGVDYEGVEFSVRSDQGDLAAEGTLGPGGPPIDRPVLKIPTCRFRSTVGVPDSQSYSVQIAHREPVRFTRADLESGHWVAYFKTPPPPKG
jgi:hypothetical protein